MTYQTIWSNRWTRWKTTKSIESDWRHKTKCLWENLRIHFAEPQCSSKCAVVWCTDERFGLLAMWRPTSRHSVIMRWNCSQTIYAIRPDPMLGSPTHSIACRLWRWFRVITAAFALKSTRTMRLHPFLCGNIFFFFWINEFSYTNKCNWIE